MLLSALVHLIKLFTFHSLFVTTTVSLGFASGLHEIREKGELRFSKVWNDVKYTAFQYIIYDWDAFLADIGGYLGLLLGQSMYGVYEILTNCLSQRVLIK